jgi:hypothetical protein
MMLPSPQNGQAHRLHGRSHPGGLHGPGFRPCGGRHNRRQVLAAQIALARARARAGKALEQFRAIEALDHGLFNLPDCHVLIEAHETPGTAGGVLRPVPSGFPFRKGSQGIPGVAQFGGNIEPCVLQGEEPGFFTLQLNGFLAIEPHDPPGTVNARREFPGQEPRAPRVIHHSRPGRLEKLRQGNLAARSDQQVAFIGVATPPLHRLKQDASQLSKASGPGDHVARKKRNVAFPDPARRFRVKTFLAGLGRRHNVHPRLGQIVGHFEKTIMATADQSSLPRRLSP